MVNVADTGPSLTIQSRAFDFCSSPRASGTPPRRRQHAIRSARLTSIRLHLLLGVTSTLLAFQARKDVLGAFNAAEATKKPSISELFTDVYDQVCNFLVLSRVDSRSFHFLTPLHHLLHSCRRTWSSSASSFRSIWRSMVSTTHCRSLRQATLRRSCDVCSIQ